jgi:hypothetical protein
VAAANMIGININLFWLRLSPIPPIGCQPQARAQPQEVDLLSGGRMTELKPAYHTSTDEVQEAMEMLGKGYHLAPRDEAKRQAFHLINATQSKVDALIDAIIDAAKAEIRAG